MSDLLDNYLACWNATDPGERRTLLLEHWTDDATYIDPLVEVAGRDELDATIAAVPPGSVTVHVPVVHGVRDIELADGE